MRTTGLFMELETPVEADVGSQVQRSPGVGVGVGSPATEPESEPSLPVAAYAVRPRMLVRARARAAGARRQGRTRVGFRYRGVEKRGCTRSSSDRSRQPSSGPSGSRSVFGIELMTF